MRRRHAISSRNLPTIFTVTLFDMHRGFKRPFAGFAVSYRIKPRIVLLFLPSNRPLTALAGQWGCWESIFNTSCYISPMENSFALCRTYWFPLPLPRGAEVNELEHSVLCNTLDISKNVSKNNFFTLSCIYRLRFFLTLFPNLAKVSHLNIM